MPDAMLETTPRTNRHVRDPLHGAPTAKILAVAVRNVVPGPKCEVPTCARNVAKALGS